MKRLMKIYTIGFSLSILLSSHLLFAQLEKSNSANGPGLAADSPDRTRALDSLLHLPASDTLFTSRPIGFREFLTRVAESNLDYAVQKYNISIAQAQVTVAKLYPDPSLSAGLTGDVSDVPANQRFGDVWNFGASQTILLGGKIGALVGVANENVSVAQAQVEDFFRNLRATAAQGYINALIADSTYSANERNYLNLAELARINEHRVAAGDLGKTDFLQSRVDAIQAHGAVLQADAARRQAFIQLGQLMGRHNADTLYRPSGNLAFRARSFNLDTLIRRAKETRTDVIAARRALESARLGVDLAHAERWPDLTLGVGYTLSELPSSNSPDDVAPFPGQKELGINLSIPLPLSNVYNKGTIRVAEFTYGQAKKSLDVAELQAETDVRQGYAQFQLAEQQFTQYSTDMLADAEKVREARLYSYKAGSASLLDVLAAENTLVSVYLAYYGAIAGYDNALVVLEQAGDIWDLEF
jgi:cobalt-zinc-cadmium efflux system outer membrane protein